jgi:hypothetical protein
MFQDSSSDDEQLSKRASYGRIRHSGMLFSSTPDPFTLHLYIISDTLCCTACFRDGAQKYTILKYILENIA